MLHSQRVLKLGLCTLKEFIQCEEENYAYSETAFQNFPENLSVRGLTAIIIVDGITELLLVP